MAGETVELFVGGGHVGQSPGLVTPRFDLGVCANRRMDNDACSRAEDSQFLDPAAGTGYSSQVREPAGCESIRFRLNPAHWNNAMPRAGVVIGFAFGGLSPTKNSTARPAISAAMGEGRSSQKQRAGTWPVRRWSFSWGVVMWGNLRV